MEGGEKWEWRNLNVNCRSSDAWRNSWREGRREWRKEIKQNLVLTVDFPKNKETYGGMD